MHEWAAAHQCSSQRQSSGAAQKIAPAGGEMPGDLVGCGDGPFEWSCQFKSTFLIASVSMMHCFLAKALN
jgi:hypothetical protein